jgi:regulator of replication initiation timing
MANKTCGECRFLTNRKTVGVCEKMKYALCPAELPSCANFEQQIITNGDKIQQKARGEMIQTDNTTLAVAQALITLRDENKALKAENEKLKSDLGIQKNLTNQACFESNRAYNEVEKWKKMFYDLLDKQGSVSTDTKVLVIESHPAESKG